MKTIIFDLCGTLIEGIDFDYQNALRWMAETYYIENIERLHALSLKFKTEYMKLRSRGYQEMSFFQQLTMFESESGNKFYDDYAVVELHFMRKFRKEKLIDGVIDLLNFLFQNNYSIYVFSNSIFSGNGLHDYLKDFEIAKYIKKVYSSADIGFRKPSKESFHHVLNDIGVTQPGDVYFVGDSLEKDYIGAKESGLKPMIV